MGDIPLVLQPKLLRVLQEQEFERLGGTRHVRSTCGSWQRRTASRGDGRGQFRVDLYYRLNVFPIVLPPLRERREDIPRLVRSFVQKLAREMNKTIHTIPSEAMSTLAAYDWPGNVRELENAIERAVILADHGVLPNPLPAPADGHHFRPTGERRPRTTLKESERRLILKDARDGGLGDRRQERGSRARTEPRAALIDPMKKLGITRPRAATSRRRRAGRPAQH